MIEQNLQHPSALIIDSDVAAASELQQLLPACGIEKVSVADTVPEALRLVDNGTDRFDLVFLELDLPGVDGMAFLRFLAERRIDCDIFIVSAMPEAIVNSVAQMVQHYGFEYAGAIGKPVTRAAVSAAVNAHRSVQSTQGDAGALVKLDRAQVRYCLGEGLFEPFFQPKILVGNEQPCGAEALARCRHPQFGLLPPAAFIEAAEDAGIIDELTFSLLGVVASELARWSSAGHQFHIAMNISSRSLASPSFCDRFFDLLQASGIAADQIIIEIRERVATLDGAARYLESLNRLRMHGIGLSIDDFGGGNSSLSNLTSIPFTELKLDRSLVSGVAAQTRLQSLVKATIRMSQELGAVTVAQGVESIEDWQFLQSLGCDMVQGFLISPALPTDEFEQWRDAWQGVGARPLPVERTEPTLPKPATLATSPPPTTTRSASGEYEQVRVLIVDDDSLVLRLLAKVLSGFGVKHIDTVQSAGAALTHLADSEVDLLITDIMMPDINGLELLKMVRTGATAAPSNLPVMMMTSLSSADNVGIAISLDANGFLVKPFKPDAVLSTLIKTLGENDLTMRDLKPYAAISTSASTADAKAAGSELVSELFDTKEKPAAVDTTADVTLNGEVVPLLELEAGMCLARSVYSTSGAKILPKGTVLDHRHINRLHQLHDVLASTEVTIVKNDGTAS